MTLREVERLEKDRATLGRLEEAGGGLQRPDKACLRNWGGWRRLGTRRLEIDARVLGELVWMAESWENQGRTEKVWRG